MRSNIIANELQRMGKGWYFHMLTPDCLLNERNDKHAFVLENRTDDRTFVNYSDDRHVNLGKSLVKILHDDNILGKKEGIVKTRIEPILAKAKDLNEKGTQWHHHMLFPDCIFNKHNKWNMVFEEKNRGKSLKHFTIKSPLMTLG